MKIRLQRLLRNYSKIRKINQCFHFKFQSMQRLWHLTDPLNKNGIKIERIGNKIKNVKLFIIKNIKTRRKRLDSVLWVREVYLEGAMCGSIKKRSKKNLLLSRKKKSNKNHHLRSTQKWKVISNLRGSINRDRNNRNRILRRW